MIEPYVGSTSRDANILEITALKKVADYEGTDRRGGFRARRKGLVPGNDRYQAALRLPISLALTSSRRREKRIRVESSRFESPRVENPGQFATPLDRTPDVHRIDVRGLSKSFQLAGTAIEAVRDVSFSVRRGEFVALLGPSGCGKSTILNMIATLISPTAARS